MNVEWAKKQWEIGVVEPDYIAFLKESYLSDIMLGNDVQSVNSLAAYAGFLNELGINSDSYPLYLEVLGTNVEAAVDVLLDGYEPDKFLECVIPNHYIVSSLFMFLNEHRMNEVYPKVLEVIIGLFARLYRSAEEGFQLYGPSIAEVNSLGKFLDETEDQDSGLNRVILDVLQFLSTLDAPHESNANKLEVARQAGRIRSDFFDNNRGLIDSLTSVTLEQASNPSFGLKPDHVYGSLAK